MSGTLQDIDMIGFDTEKVRTYFVEDCPFIVDFSVSYIKKNGRDYFLVLNNTRTMLPTEMAMYALTGMETKQIDSKSYIVDATSTMKEYGNLDRVFNIVANNNKRVIIRI